MKKDWYKHALCKVHMDMHCPEWSKEIFENFDAKKVISMAKKTGADALYFFTKDCYGNAYYRTKIGHIHACIGKRDFLDEILKEAAKIDFPIMAYYTVIWDNFAAEKHPEWCMRGPDGKALTDTITMDVGKWKYVCHNTGYAQYAAKMIEEISKNYPVNGFHLDMFNMDFGGLSCYCKTCQKLFKEQTGKELPRVPKWDKTWQQFLEFRYRTVEKFAESLRQAALKYKPDICVVMNYHGSPNFDWRVGQQPVRHSLFSDLGTGETYTPMLGDMYPGMEARFIRNLVPGKPFEMVSWRMNRVTDFTVKPLNQLRWEIFTSIVNGGSAMLIDQPFYDGQPDPVAYDRMGQVFREANKVKKYLDADYVKHIGIYYSCRSRDLYGRDQQAKFIQPVMGAYKALAESHYNIDFLFDETMTEELLAKYPVVVLPCVGALSEAEAELFRNYVKNGGKLIAGFDTSLYSGDGDKLTNFQLADVFGVDFVKTYDCDTNYFRNIQKPLGSDIDQRYFVLNQGQVHLVKKTTAKGIGDLHDSFYKRIMPTQFFSHNIHPPYKRLSDAVYVNKFGKGTCYYVPFELDRSYADHYELPEHRTLIRNIIDNASNPPLVKIKAPLNVETLITQKGNQIFVHLISFNPIRQANSLPRLDKPIRPSIRMEEAAMYEAAIEFKTPVKSVRSFQKGTEVKLGKKKINLLCKNVYELIIIEKANSK